MTDPDLEKRWNEALAEQKRLMVTIEAKTHGPEPDMEMANVCARQLTLVMEELNHLRAKKRLAEAAAADQERARLEAEADARARAATEAQAKAEAEARAQQKAADPTATFAERWNAAVSKYLPIILQDMREMARARLEQQRALEEARRQRLEEKRRRNRAAAGDKRERVVLEIDDNDEDDNGARAHRRRFKRLRRGPLPDDRSAAADEDGDHSEYEYDSFVVPDDEVDEPDEESYEPSESEDRSTSAEEDDEDDASSDGEEDRDNEAEAEEEEEEEKEERPQRRAAQNTGWPAAVRAHLEAFVSAHRRSYAARQRDLNQAIQQIRAEAQQGRGLFQGLPLRHGTRLSYGDVNRLLMCLDRVVLPGADGGRPEAEWVERALQELGRWETYAASKP